MFADQTFTQPLFHYGLAFNKWRERKYDWKSANMPPPVITIVLICVAPGPTVLSHHYSTQTGLQVVIIHFPGELVIFRPFRLEFGAFLLLYTSLCTQTVDLKHFWTLTCQHTVWFLNEELQMFALVDLSHTDSQVVDDIFKGVFAAWAPHGLWGYLPKGEWLLLDLIFWTRPLFTAIYLTSSPCRTIRYTIRRLSE